MKFSTFKGYVLVIVSGLVVLAALLLVVLQWGNTSVFSLYGKNVEANTGLLVILSAVGGVVVMFMTKALFHGALILRKARRKPDET